MAWSHTNSFTQSLTGGASSEVITLSFTPTTDRLLVLVVMDGGTGEGITSVVGAGVKGTGNNFSLAKEQSDADVCSMWYGVVGASPSTSITINFSGALNGHRYVVDEWSGNNTDQAAVLENAGSAHEDSYPGNSTGITIPAVAVAIGNLLMTAAVADSSLTGMAPSGTFTSLENADLKLFTAYRIAAETSDANVWTWSSPSTFGCGVLAGFFGLGLRLKATLGQFTKDIVPNLDNFDTSMSLRYGAYDDDFVTQFGATAFATATQVYSVPLGVFSKDAINGGFDVGL